MWRRFLRFTSLSCSGSNQPDTDCDQQQCVESYKREPITRRKERKIIENTSEDQDICSEICHTNTVNNDQDISLNDSVVSNQHSWHHTRRSSDIRKKIYNRRPYIIPHYTSQVELTQKRFDRNRIQQISDMLCNPETGNIYTQCSKQIPPSLLSSCSSPRFGDTGEDNNAKNSEGFILVLKGAGQKEPQQGHREEDTDTYSTPDSLDDKLTQLNECNVKHKQREEFTDAALSCHATVLRDAKKMEIEKQNTGPDYLRKMDEDVPTVTTQSTFDLNNSFSYSSLVSIIEGKNSSLESITEESNSFKKTGCLSVYTSPSFLSIDSGSNVSNEIINSSPIDDLKAKKREIEDRLHKRKTSLLSFAPSLLSFDSDSNISNQTKNDLKTKTRQIEDRVKDKIIQIAIENRMKKRHRPWNETKQLNARIKDIILTKGSLSEI